jgi:dihydrolipoamide dehydrogenase
VHAVEHDVDVCVIGTGPGGYIAAVRAAQLGLKTAVVEREELGGICLNRGCIPTKAMLRSAEVLTTLQHAADYGVNAENVSFDYGKVIARRDKVVKQLTSGVGGLLKSYGVEVVRGSGRLAGGKVVVTGDSESTVNARNVIIATGSVPAKLPIPGVDGPNVIDSDGALALTEVPKSILIIGGGAIGCEWACVFAAFGSKVTLVEMLPTLLPLEDEDMGKTLARSLGRQGVTIHTEARLEEIAEGDKGESVGVLTLKDGKQERVSAEKVLVGVGRKPNTDGLGLDGSGVKADRRGFIEVDDHLRTSVPNVYAIGDVTGKQLLAHLASHQGVAAAEAIAGTGHPMDYKVVPACTYTHPEVASVGLSEAKARDAGYDVRIGRFPFQASGRALTYGEAEGLVKVVADAKYGELLGVHIIGPQASELIPEAALGIRLEATLEDITTTIHAHPTLAEAVAEAAWAATGAALNLPKPRQRS